VIQLLILRQKGFSRCYWWQRLSSCTSCRCYALALAVTW